MKKLIALFCALSSLLLTGCGGGSIYSNYRETEQLTVIQTLGLDLTPVGIRASVATGTGATPKPVRISAEDESIDLALRRIADYSVSEEMFFAHTAYVLVGENTAGSDLGLVLDYIKRSTDMRLDMPVFIVKDASASELVLGAGDESGDKGADYDITEVMRSIERSLDNSGDGVVFTAAEISRSLDGSGAALVCMVESRNADEALEGAGNALTALPGGFAVIKDGRKLGRIDTDDAPAVSLIMGRSGPSRIALNVGSPVTVQLDEAKADITPIIDGGSLTGITVNVKLTATLLEGKGDPSAEELSAALKSEYEKKLTKVLGLSKSLSADFLGLGSMLERKEPLALRGIGEKLGDILPELSILLSVSAEITGSTELFLLVNNCSTDLSASAR